MEEAKGKEKEATDVRAFLRNNQLSVLEIALLKRETPVTMTDLVDGIIDDEFLQTEFSVNDPLLRRRFLKACEKLRPSPTPTPGWFYGGNQRWLEAVDLSSSSLTNSQNVNKNGNPFYYLCWSGLCWGATEELSSPPNLNKTKPLESTCTSSPCSHTPKNLNWTQQANSFHQFSSSSSLRSRTKVNSTDQQTSSVL